MSIVYSAYTTAPGEAQAQALGEALERLEPEPQGVGVFKVEDGSGTWEVAAYFTESPDEVQLMIAAAAYGAKPFAISELPETDWVAKVRRELHPVEAGRFFVYGSHDADRVPEGRVALLIEASMAFGTGHHETTLGCLRAFDRLLDAGFAPGRVADVGAGTAVLAMAAAKTVPDARIIAGDIDAVAVEVAEANLLANGLEGRVDCVEAAGLDHAAFAEAAPFDLVFANILKGPLIDIAPDMARAIAPEGGRAILSGILTTQRDDVISRYGEFGLKPEEIDEIGEWSTLTLRR